MNHRDASERENKFKLWLCVKRFFIVRCTETNELVAHLPENPLTFDFIRSIKLCRIIEEQHRCKKALHILNHWVAFFHSFDIIRICTPTDWSIALMCFSLFLFSSSLYTCLRRINRNRKYSHIHQKWLASPTMKKKVSNHQLIYKWKCWISTILWAKNPLTQRAHWHELTLEKPLLNAIFDCIDRHRELRHRFGPPFFYFSLHSNPLMTNGKMWNEITSVWIKKYAHKMRTKCAHIFPLKTITRAQMSGDESLKTQNSNKIELSHTHES